MSMEAEEIELWRRYRSRADADARDFLFLRYSNWARSIAVSVARRLKPGILEWQDHLQNARVGLLEAMSRYDVERGVDFMAYAKPRIRGAVFNGVRSSAVGRDPETIASIGLERIGSLSEEESSDPLLGFIDSIVGLGIGYLLEDGHDVVNAEQSELLMDALLELPSRQRDVLIQHYLRQIQFQDIASALCLTKGRISQIHKEALQGMRAILRARRYDRDSFF